jgi:hypothetical protein
MSADHAIVGWSQQAHELRLLAQHVEVLPRHELDRPAPGRRVSVRLQLHPGGSGRGEELPHLARRELVARVLEHRPREDLAMLLRRRSHAGHEQLPRFRDRQRAAIAFTSENTAVAPPMPRASETTAVNVKPGLRRNPCAKRSSRKNSETIVSLTVHGYPVNRNLRTVRLPPPHQSARSTVGPPKRRGAGRQAAAAAMVRSKPAIDMRDRIGRAHLEEQSRQQARDQERRCDAGDDATAREGDAC